MARVGTLNAMSQWADQAPEVQHGGGYGRQQNSGYVPPHLRNGAAPPPPPGGGYPVGGGGGYPPAQDFGGGGGGYGRQPGGGGWGGGGGGDRRSGGGGRYGGGGGGGRGGALRMPPFPWPLRRAPMRSCPGMHLRHRASKGVGPGRCTYIHSSIAIARRAMERGSRIVFSGPRW